VGTVVELSVFSFDLADAGTEFAAKIKKETQNLWRTCLGTFTSSVPVRLMLLSTVE
jgi:hypothetical protein